jgi:hypothetical protein
VSTSCRRRNYCRGNARSRSMASLVCARPAFNNIAGLVVRESLSAPLNLRVESMGYPLRSFSYQHSLGEPRGRLQTSGRL